LKSQFNRDKAAAMSFPGFSCFWGASFSCKLFPALAPRSGFGAGFGQERLLSWQRHSIGFCNLVLAHRIRVAASMLLSVAVAQSSMVFAPLLPYVAVAHIVPWSFATCCLQMAMEWLRQSCNN